MKAGAELFAKNCASCHGKDAMGTGNVPSLARGPVQAAPDGEVVWFIGKGSVENGMPPSTLPESERWKIVTFLKSLKGVAASPVDAAPPFPVTGPSEPPAPFTDYRFEKPGQFHKMTGSGSTPSGTETSVGNAPEVVSRPADAWPKVPPGFEVQLYATGLDNPRLLRTAPNGDVFLAESSSGKIRVFRGLTKEGKPERAEVFATGLKRTYGIAFYPPGKNPKWLYVGSTNAVVRFPYQAGDLHATGRAQKVADLPSLFWRALDARSSVQLGWKKTFCSGRVGVQRG